MYVSLSVLCNALRGQKRAEDFPGTGVKDNCESPCGFWT